MVYCHLRCGPLPPPGTGLLSADQICVDSPFEGLGKAHIFISMSVVFSKLVAQNGGKNDYSEYAVAKSAEA